MSDDKISELEAKIDGISRLAPWIKSLLFGAFCLGVWVTRLQMQVSEHQSLAPIVHNLEIAAAGTANNRYTSEDHLKYAMTIQESLNSQEKRIAMMEDLGKRVLDTLTHIENRLNKMP
jgi:hypothetical protein